MNLLITCCIACVERFMYVLNNLLRRWKYYISNNYGFYFQYLHPPEDIIILFPLSLSLSFYLALSLILSVSSKINAHRSFSVMKRYVGDESRCCSWLLRVQARVRSIDFVFLPCHLHLTFTKPLSLSLSLSPSLPCQ